MADVPHEDLLGFPVYRGTPGQCVASIIHAISTRDGCRWLACLNPHSYAVALRRPDFEAALKSAYWLVPDGIGVVLASRYRRGRIRERITGFDVFEGVHRELERRGGGRIFFLGSTESTLSEIRQRMQREHPLLTVVGTMSPPFAPSYTDGQVEEMVAAINAASPDVLWVGLTAPKQELWLSQVGSRLSVPFAAGIGAVFDFYTGRIRRSSPGFQRAGLEWLPRLVQEPRRLWRRMFVSAPVFVWHVLTRGRR